MDLVDLNIASEKISGSANGREMKMEQCRL